jgi:(5-formylfuran-3-yl)methyl phosphate synthase
MLMKLMISVISGAEARAAIKGGAEILDIKNPYEGALGAQPPGIIREIRSIAPDGLAVSAAIGDMPHLPGTASLAALGAAVCNVDYIKVGLFGQRNETEAIAILSEIKRSVQDYDISIIAALYADYERAATIDPKLLPGIAAKARIQGCLLDTAIKDGRGLFDFIHPDVLQYLIKKARDADIQFGIAGGLTEQDLPLIRELNPDIAGFRTAVCRNQQRLGDLDPTLVQKLKDRLSL